MRKINAFTLIELLVVIAIIGILSALIIVGMSSTTQKATIAKAQAFSHSVDSALLSSKVSEWKFESGSHISGQEADINDVKDTWGSNNATSVGTTPGPTIKEGADCVSGKCLSFDGDDYIDLGNNDNLNVKNITIGFWFKQNVLPIDYDSIISRGMWSVNPRNWQVGINSTNLIQLDIAKSQTEYSNVQTDALDIGKWNYITLTFNGTNLKSYRNGIYKNYTDFSGQIQSATGRTIYIGRAHDCCYLIGLVDDVRIYSEAIPTSQIQQNYFAGLNKFFAKRGIEISEYQQKISELQSNYAKN